MKKITVTLTDEAEKVFNDLMYSLPKDEDGTGMCTQSQAINHSLEALSDLEAKGHVAFMDDPPQSSKENNADITKVNGVFVNPTLPAITENDIDDVAIDVANRYGSGGEVWKEYYRGAKAGIKAMLIKINPPKY